MKKTLFLLTIAVIGLNNCQQSTPNIPEESFKYEPFLQSPISNAKSKEFKAFIAPENAPTCAAIPTIDEVKTGQWTFTDHFYSASQALKIGIPIVNSNAAHDLKVYVKDYRRVATCIATDNSTTILYGQVIRTVIEIENYDASIGLDLASIAANGTLKKNTQHFYFYKDGFFNAKIDDILASVQGKVFDVQNYALFQSVMGDVIKLLKDSTTTFSVNRIGIQQQLSEENEIIEKSSVVAYSLMSIFKGKSCNTTKKKFENNKSVLEIVENTYTSLGVPIGDETPSDESMSNAKKYLQGIRVKL